MLKPHERNPAMVSLVRHVTQPRGALLTGVHTAYPLDGPHANLVKQLTLPDILAWLLKVLVEAIVKALAEGHQKALARRADRLAILARRAEEIDEDDEPPARSPERKLTRL